MRKTHTTLLGKTIRHASRLKGGGSALPGLVVEKIDKDFPVKLIHTREEEFLASHCELKVAMAREPREAR